MNFNVNEKIVLRQQPEGPLAPYISQFAQDISAQGYAGGYVHRHVLLASDFSHWLMCSGVKLDQIVFNHTCDYLQYRAKSVKPTRGDRANLDHLLKFLRDAGIIRSEPVTTTPALSSIDRCTDAYEQYLRNTRGLADSTILNYVPFIRTFLENRFGTSRVILSSLTAYDVVAFVDQQARQLHKKRAKLLTCALRSYLKYTVYSGHVSLDLAAAVPVVPNWSMPSICRAISPEQVEQLLASIDQSTAMGRRDYAILLLLARIGLRSGEIVFLELRNINWNAGTLTVKTKGGQYNTFPLPAEVGKAIAAYLQEGRPSCTSGRVFVRARAPYRGFQCASGVGSIVRHCLQRCGVEAPTLGTHQFRHGLATDMLRHGASLGEIGDVLGHNHPQTTKIYTKVDLEALRLLAVRWPGGVQ